MPDTVTATARGQRNLRLREYGLEIPGLGRAAYRVGQVRSRLQKERSL